VIAGEATTRHSFPAWLPFALLTLLGWGLWGVVQKPLTDRIDVWSIAFLQSGTTLTLGLLFALVRRQSLDPRREGFKFAASAGMMSYLATLGFLVAVDRGSASVVVPLTAMYPVVTIVLGVAILKERLTRAHQIGVVLALAAIFFLSR
jgi:transporter family protein